MKKMRMKLKIRHVIASGLLSIIIYLIGRWLSSINGFDPPYFLYFFGQILILVSILLVLVMITISFILIIRRLKKHGG